MQKLDFFLSALAGQFGRAAEGCLGSCWPGGTSHEPAVPSPSPAGMVSAVGGAGGGELPTGQLEPLPQSYTLLLSAEMGPGS